MRHSGTGSRARRAQCALIVALAVCRAGAAAAQTPAPPGGRQALTGVLTLNDAIARGLDYNLATMGLTTAAGRARGDRTVARSALLPNLTGDFSATDQRLNLAAQGVSIQVPNFTIPSVVGPFKVIDLRARVTQSIFDAPARNTYRAAQENVRASDLAIDDARDRIVLSVGSAFLEAVAAQGRLAATQAEVATATSQQQQLEQRQAAGLATPLEISRARVATLSARQRLTAFEADVAKRKIDLARLIGLPPTDQYEIPREIPYAPAPALTVEQALTQANERADVAAAAAQVAAAERALAAARGERLPTVFVLGDVGASQAMSDPTHATYTVAGVVRVPIWQGGRVAGRVEQAVAALSQRRVQLDDLKAQIEADVRRAFVDLRTADGQVAVTRDNLQVMRDTLAYVQQQFGSGLAEDVAVVQSRQAVAAAEFEYTNSVFAHNLAKLGLARAIGRAAGNLSQFLVVP